jgi:hypothetical protein
MKKLLLASVFALVPFVAFAHDPRPAQPQAATFSASGAAVGSIQGTVAGAKVDGNGAVIVGTVSGNYTNVQTNGTATAGPRGSFTSANAAQTNIGGTISGGAAHEGWGRGNEASGFTAGGQASVGLGGSIAVAGSKTQAAKPE